MFEVSMRCPCGAHAVVDITASPRAETGWSCKCPDCYDGTDDAGERAHCLGYGATPEAAIAAWWEQIEQAWEIDYLPNMLFADLSEQAGDEAERQSLWAYSSEANDGAPRWYAPAGAELPPIPIAWPGVAQ